MAADLAPLAWTILFAPLFAAAVIGLFTRRHRGLSAALAVGAMGLGLACTLTLLWNSLAAHDAAGFQSEFEWIRVGAFNARFGVVVDRLSLLMSLVVTGVGQAAFGAKANGSPIEAGERVVGSRLLGQPFSSPKYFWSRPSATTPQPYNGAVSSGSNQGPLNPALESAVKDRIAALRAADLVQRGRFRRASGAGARALPAGPAKTRGVGAKGAERGPCGRNRVPRRCTEGTA